jgi:hypothetical protein
MQVAGKAPATPQLFRLPKLHSHCSLEQLLRQKLIIPLSVSPDDTRMEVVSECKRTGSKIVCLFARHMGPYLASTGEVARDFDGVGLDETGEFLLYKHRSRRDEYIHVPVTNAQDFCVEIVCRRMSLSH